MRKTEIDKMIDKYLYIKIEIEIRKEEKERKIVVLWILKEDNQNRKKYN